MKGSKIISGIRPVNNTKEMEARDDVQGEEIKKKTEVDETIRTIEISGLKSYMQAQSRAAKIFWLVLLIMATTILVWQLYKTIDNYINSPIVSTYTITTVPEMEFPIVYLCPTTLTHAAFLNRTPNAEQEALFLKEDMGVVWNYVKFLAGGNLSDTFRMSNIDRESQVVPQAFRRMTRVNIKKYNFTDSSDSGEIWNSTEDKHTDPEWFFKNATIPLDWHIRHCEFRSFLFENMPCSNITREVFDPEYGKCYVIDVGSRKQAVQSQGLLVVFNAQSGDASPTAPWSFPKNSPLTPLFNGVVVGIEREYNVRGSGERVFASPGTYNRIDLALQQQEFKNFDHPYYQRCTNAEDFEYKIFDVKYTQQSCGYDCVARALRDQCKCIPPIDRSLYKKGVLNETNEFCMGQHLQCIRDKVHQNATVTAEIEKCRSQCHVPCSDWRYDVRATYMDLYKPSFASFQFVPDITYLLVAYSHMEYTKFTQNDSTTPDEMIANIGGEVGLWLGASMMTLIQLPLSLITFCGLCCVKKTKKAATTVRDVRERRKSMMPT